MFVRVAEMRVAGGRVRGLVDRLVVLSEDVGDSNVRDGRGNGLARKTIESSVSGWVSLFEPPSLRWAEFTPRIE